ncbi:MAG: hypothetical protein ACYC3P_11365 [Bellilinea sp.]
MENKLNVKGVVVLLIVAWLQIIMTQVVTFIVSLIFPDIGDYMNTQPAMFLLLLAICFSVGIFLAGWAAIKWRWLKISALWAPRLVGTLIGTSMPLLLAYLLYHPIEPGNPFFFISMLTGVLGFHIPGWMRK